jgi:hypothetical protein
MSIDLVILTAVAFAGVATWQLIMSMPRRGGTIGQGVVVLLYRWARFWRAVAEAGDAAVLNYHVTKDAVAIAPQSWTQLGQPMPGTPHATCEPLSGTTGELERRLANWSGPLPEASQSGMR